MVSNLAPRVMPPPVTMVPVTMPREKLPSVYVELNADASKFLLLASSPDPDAMAHLAGLIQTCTPLFEGSDPPGGYVCPATWAAAVQLSQTLGEAWTPSPRVLDWIKAQILRRTNQACDLDAPIPPLSVLEHLPAGLKPYSWQALGAELIATLGNPIIVDDPGTGKTITAILGLVERASRTLAPLTPVLIVCPASVVDAWVEAWETWAPHVRAVAWRGDRRRRLRLIGRADVYVASWDMARADAGPSTQGRHRPLIMLSPGAVVLDEAHYAKNPQAARTKAVRRLAKIAHDRTGTVIPMTGTPIGTHAGDFWPIVDLAEPGAWPSKDRWVNRYCQVSKDDYDRESDMRIAPWIEPEFRQALLGQMRRVSKADAMPELPAKVHSIRTVELPPAARAAYDSMESDMIAELADGGEVSIMWKLAALGALCQMASATAVKVEVTHGPDVDELTGELKRHQHVILGAPSWKVDALLEVMAERPGQPVVAFAPSRQLVELAGVAATKAGYRVGYIVGGQGSARTPNIRAFQAGELDLICVTTKAGGTGITLTRSACAVFLQRPWSMVDAVQAEDRLHRIGAEGHESIEIIDIVAKATIDTRIRSVLKGKAGNLADLVQDPRIVQDLFGGNS
jgi:SNF2 family DNA or RNA helicase